MVRINGGGDLSRDVRFWLDDWVEMGPLCGLFPKLFRLAANKDSSVSNCFEVRSDCNIRGVLFKRGLWSLEGNYMRSY